MRLVAGKPYSLACQSESHNSGFSSRGRPSCKKSWWPLRSSNKNAWRLQNASNERQAKRKSLHHFVPPTPIYWSYGGRSGDEMSSELYSSIIVALAAAAVIIRYNIRFCVECT